MFAHSLNSRIFTFYSYTVNGYKEKVLAVRPSAGMQKLFDIRYFWLFTLLGLTVPYRIRFGKHCDEVRVAVLKEVSSDRMTDNGSSSLSKTSWFASPRSWLWGPDTRSEVVHDQRQRFKKHMQEISLYQGGKDTTEVPLMNDDVDDASMTEVDTDRGSKVKPEYEDELKSIGNGTSIDAVEGATSNTNASDGINTHGNDDANEKEDYSIN
jgi:hypothetical protein